MYSSRAEVTKLHKEYAHLQREFKETLRARGEEVVTPRAVMTPREARDAAGRLFVLGG